VQEPEKPTVAQLLDGLLRRTRTLLVLAQQPVKASVVPMTADPPAFDTARCLLQRHRQALVEGFHVHPVTDATSRVAVRRRSICPRQPKWETKWKVDWSGMSRRRPFHSARLLTRRTSVHSQSMMG
jgi:hypothetical protein